MICPRLYRVRFGRRARDLAGRERSMVSAMLLCRCEEEGWDSTTCSALSGLRNFWDPTVTINIVCTSLFVWSQLFFFLVFIVHRCLVREHTDRRHALLCNSIQFWLESLKMMTGIREGILFLCIPRSHTSYQRWRWQGPASGIELRDMRMKVGINNDRELMILHALLPLVNETVCKIPKWILYVCRCLSRCMKLHEKNSSEWE